jgi:hypothetical protein
MDAVVIDLTAAHLVRQRIAEVSLFGDLTLQQGLVMPAAKCLGVDMVAAARYAIMG